MYISLQQATQSCGISYSSSREEMEAASSVQPY